MKGNNERHIRLLSLSESQSIFLIEKFDYRPETRKFASTTNDFKICLGAINHKFQAVKVFQKSGI